MSGPPLANDVQAVARVVDLKHAVALVRLQQAANQAAVLRVVVNNDDGCHLLVEALEGRAQPFSYLHAARPWLRLGKFQVEHVLVFEDMLLRREGVAGAVDDHRFGGGDHAAGDQVFQPGEGHCRRRLHTDPLDAGQAAHSAECLPIGDSDHRPIGCQARLAQQRVGTARVARSQHGDARLRADRLGHFVPGLPRRDHRRAARRLHQRQARQPVN